jgi:hypothetical protein
MGKTQFLEQLLHSAVEAVVVEIFLQEQTLLVKTVVLVEVVDQLPPMELELEQQVKEIMELQEIPVLRFKAVEAVVQEPLERLLEEATEFNLI